MSHVRQQIREATGTLLSGLVTTSTRIFESRVYNLQETELPCLVITTNDESVEEGTLKALIRSLTLTIEGKAKATTNLDDTLDTIASEVEIKMATSPTLGGKVVGHSLSTTSIEMSVEGDQPIGSISLNYDVVYMTPEGNPTIVA